MSPVGGVGINLAIQDAVATANVLAAPLRGGAVTTDLLRAVQRRRELPTRLTQALQVFIQHRVLSRVLDMRGTIAPPLLLRLLDVLTPLHYIPAYVVGVGFRPEHVRTPAIPTDAAILRA